MRARTVGRRGRRRHPLQPPAEAVLSARPAMRPGTVLGCCVSLLVAGVLLARGFVGVLPSRPAYLVMGTVLGATALLGLVIDHVVIRVRPEQPDHVLVAELDRSRRYHHPLSIVALRADEVVALRVVARLRTTDHAWRSGELLVVLLSETDHRGAADFALRLADLVEPGAVRIASFPDDAVTAEGLFSALAPLEARDPAPPPDRTGPSPAPVTPGA